VLQASKQDGCSHMCLFLLICSSLSLSASFVFHHLALHPDTPPSLPPSLPRWKTLASASSRPRDGVIWTRRRRRRRRARGKEEGGEGRRRG